MPQISVIVPVYKVEAYIHRCVDSILSQSYTDFELIIVDDGSPDNCGTICDKYAKLDSRIHVIHQKNGGLSAARNAGIDWAFANSNSQWLTFIDSDDWIHPEYLYFLLNAAVSANLPLSICNFVRTTGTEPIIDSKNLNAIVWDSEDFFVEHNVNAIIACGKVYKKESFRHIRFPVGRIHEDEFTTYKLLFATKKVAVIDAPLYYYYQNDNGIMRSPWSPKRLVLLSAFRERLFFLISKGYQKAYFWHVNHYWIHVKSFANHLKNSSVEDIKKYTPFIKKHLRTALRHGRKINLISFHGNEHYYEQAYPFAMKIYWNYKGILYKFFKRK